MLADNLNRITRENKATIICKSGKVEVFARSGDVWINGEHSDYRAHSEDSTLKLSLGFFREILGYTVNVTENAFDGLDFDIRSGE
ncbi:MAG: hypothetical protein LBN02_02645 [Oscillospiraceae bacterium]|jgi:hypothetical protein|nr:hypothetical protein [Oscillospiraceae bacterium]